jgi:hypothetical protein
MCEIIFTDVFKLLQVFWRVLGYFSDISSCFLDRLGLPVGIDLKDIIILHRKETGNFLIGYSLSIIIMLSFVGNLLLKQAPIFGYKKPLQDDKGETL